MGGGKRSSILNRPSAKGKDKLDGANQIINLSGDDLYPAALRQGTAVKPGKSAEPFKHKKPHVEEQPSFYILITTVLAYQIIFLFGRIRDFIAVWFKKNKYMRYQNGYAPLLNSGFDAFYKRHIYNKIRDSFNRPTTAAPGRFVKVYQRESYDGFDSFIKTGEIKECLNLSSYNYLGFVQSEGPCADAVAVAINEFGVGVGSSRMDAGTTNQLLETEALVARFLGQESAILVSMGFAMNATSIPALVGKGCLIVSDELNHSSIVLGSRMSGATIKVFKHNDTADLERVLRKQIAYGQPRSGRAWKKVLVVCEGLYSMEGTYCPLPGILELKKKYKFYLYIDEAHSMMAIGPNAKGVCDYYGVAHSNVDVLMGTFTKSFGSAGGYIAGRKAIIDHLRVTNHSAIYAESLTPVGLGQIQACLKILMGEDGTDEGRRRITSLRQNSLYFSRALRKLGFIVYGMEDSPVVPLMLYHPTKMPAFSREMLARNIAVVVVGAPATPILKCRVRFCISASHTLEDLEKAVEAINEVGDRLNLKHSRKIRD
ncbi:pyridoxal phosphate-dependent transferase [Cladochytrium replicatum]|nr:pyridoxal phosphate-dependent transferase [Cladochytrium replicatum]